MGYRRSKTIQEGRSARYVTCQDGQPDSIKFELVKCRMEIIDTGKLSNAEARALEIEAVAEQLRFLKLSKKFLDVTE